MKKQLIFYTIVSLAFFQPIVAISEWHRPMHEQPQQAIAAVPQQNQGIQPLGALQQDIEQQRLNLRRETIRNFKKFCFVAGFWTLGYVTGAYLLNRNQEWVEKNIGPSTGPITLGVGLAGAYYGLRALADRLF